MVIVQLFFSSPLFLYTLRTVSIGLVFVNKFLLSGQESPVIAPLSVTCFQCAVSFGHAFSKSFAPFKLNIRSCWQIAPLTLIFVGMVTANNLCLKYISVAFYYIARSTTVIFNVVSSILLRWRNSRKCDALTRTLDFHVFDFGSEIVTAEPRAFTAYFSPVLFYNILGSFSLVGVILGVLSTIFVALNAIYTKKMLPVVEDSTWQLAFYNNFNSLFVFLPLILVSGEVSEIMNLRKGFPPNFWLLLISSGIFGFLISYLTVLQVKVTSALTHNVSATAKSAFQTVLAVIVYSESKDMLWWASNVVVLISSFAYSYVRHREMEATLSMERTYTLLKETESVK
ncbi:GDP fucose transporter 1 [Trichuris trichiura]|uniref:GDP fucose transporter 1 n=1 Tax=Trichuris trichiura TaxID=36087 RepID=A0A077YZV9_TRITR|nr:GDP fucose transporter 1 [Trichuris trichiura]